MNTAILKTEQEFLSLERGVGSSQIRIEMTEKGVWENFIKTLATRLREFREFLQSA